MERLSIYLHGLDEELKPLIRELAEASNRSFSAQVVVLLKQALRMDEEPYTYEVEIDDNQA